MEWTKENLKSLTIREYLWNCGDIDDIIGVYEEVTDTDVDDDFFTIIDLIDEYCEDIIKEFNGISHLMSEIDFFPYIDEYEEKIEKRLEEEKINDLTDVKFIKERYDYFKDNNLEGDPVEEVIYMLWDAEEEYGNPFDVTEEEHDTIVRPVVKKVIQSLTQSK
jgi:hypothetical protein